MRYSGGIGTSLYESNGQEDVAGTDEEPCALLMFGI